MGLPTRPGQTASLSARVRFSVSRTEPAPALGLHAEPLPPPATLSVSRTEEPIRQDARLRPRPYSAPAGERQNERPLPAEQS
jgi:hypothetical protein